MSNSNIKNNINNILATNPTADLEAENAQAQAQANAQVQEDKNTIEEKSDQVHAEVADHKKAEVGYEFHYVQTNDRDVQDNQYRKQLNNLLSTHSQKIAELENKIAEIEANYVSKIKISISNDC